MKKTFKLLFAALAATLAAASCVEEQVLTEFSSDPESLLEVPCKDASDQVLSLKTNVNWIVITPTWVKANPVFGSGNTMVTFTVENNYVNDKTDVEGRSGEIVFSGGGSSYKVLISQQGYTAPYDPSASIGGIPDVEEFMKFVEAVNTNDGTTRWQNASKEVELLADINLSDYTEWTPIGNPETVTNGNTSHSYTGSAFKGVFNGGNHTIRGFKPTVKVAENGTFGLFGVLDGATVKDLTIETDINLSAAAQADAGVLVGTSVSSTISNVTVRGKITSSGTDTDNKRYTVGGIAGFVFNTGPGTSQIKNCTVNLTADVKSGANTKSGATGCMFGGLIGFITASGDGSCSYVENCVANGEITSQCGRSSGICATSNTFGVFKNCTNNANQVNTFVDGRVGNIVSLIGKGSSIEDCVNNGNLTTTDSKTTTGAIVALFNDDSVILKGGKNTGTIIGANSKYLGLIGANLSKFKSISDFTVGGKLGNYKADGNHEMIDVNAGNFEQYIGSVSDANRAKISNLTWNGEAAPPTPVIEGIATADDLKEFASLVNNGGDYSKFVVGGAVVLGADIDLGGAEWAPIGQGTISSTGEIGTGKPFTGVFDGQGHSIDNFKVTVAADATANTAAGLFGIISEATVKNVVIGPKAVLSGASKAASYIGGVVGFALNSTIEGCTNKATMSLTAGTENIRECLGGIAGEIYTTDGKTTTVKNCTNEGVLSSVNSVNTKNGGTGLSVGGIVAFSDSPKETAPNAVLFCTNKAAITAEATRLAGILASANKYTKIEDCVNEGKITGQDVTASNSRIAGICSAVGAGNSITRCINRGDIVFDKAGDTTHGYAAGILGQANEKHTIDACENYGTIRTDFIKSTDKFVGAILGNPNSKVVTVTKCKVGGKVGPLTEDDTYKVVTITTDNFKQYITLNTSKAGNLKIEDDNVCGN